ncbi:hypothetical protein I4F81_003542 [Pyropia yezoensis]|uniref:Uncharacterized protein n=1 Tax=Pyropia yezoensis TaxID=2788 RepID=A0ACC3BSF5_PYRYE|nr:hypothetical protein I4F81_003542 [Neopyropia yezoensis]
MAVAVRPSRPPLHAGYSSPLASMNTPSLSVSAGENAPSPAVDTIVPSPSVDTMAPSPAADTMAPSLSTAAGDSAPTERESAGEHAPPAAADTIFPSLSTAAGDSAPTEIESLCMNCHKQGTTRLLLTSIPFYKDVVLMSFSCPHCHFRSSEVQPGGSIAPKGISLTLTASQASDLQRSVLLSDAATVSVAELELTVPPASRGRLTTVEGILGDVAEGLTFHQAERREADPTQAAAVDAFLGRLAAARVGVDPFTLTVRDPSGNSHIEAEVPGRRDPRLRVTHFERTPDESLSLGLNPANAPAVDASADAAADATPAANGSAASVGMAAAVTAAATAPDFAHNEVLAFREACPACAAPGENRMKVTTIPHFKEVVIMAFVCASCGYKSTEVKPGGGVEPRGTRTTLAVTRRADLSRDVLKSEPATVEVPELELELAAGTLGGRFTTVEGLLVAIKDQLTESNPFAVGDSAATATRNAFTSWLGRLDDTLSADRPSFTLILDDPTGNSYVQNVYAPDVDPQLSVTSTSLSSS